MAITNGYATLAELKPRLDIKNNTDEDALLNSVIEGVSRGLDGWLGWEIAIQTRVNYYTAEHWVTLEVDPIAYNFTDGAKITAIETDDDGDGTYETTWTTTDYFTYPRNPRRIDTVSSVVYGKPITVIKANINYGNYQWPVGVQDGVKITATFGYCEIVPPAIKEACLLLSERVYKRKDSIFGVSGTAGLGTLVVNNAIQQDSELKFLLHDHKRLYWG